MTLNCTSGLIQGRTTCNGKVHIQVHAGQADVKARKVERVLAGKDATLDNPVEFTAPLGSSIALSCGRPVAGAYLTGPGLLGILALIGIGVAVARRIELGGETSSGSRLPTSGG